MDDFKLQLDEDETQCQEADSILNKSSDCSQREERHQGHQSKLKSKAETIKEAESSLALIMKRKASGDCPKHPKKTELKVVIVMFGIFSRKLIRMVKTMLNVNSVPIN